MPPAPRTIDLHGLHVDQALARFAEAYAHAASTARGARLIVIHGWNASDFKHSIAAAIHRLLKHRGVEFEYPHEGNRGRTLVHTGPPVSTPRVTRVAPKPDLKPRSLRGGL